MAEVTQQGAAYCLLALLLPLYLVPLPSFTMVTKDFYSFRDN